MQRNVRSVFSARVYSVRVWLWERRTLAANSRERKYGNTMENTWHLRGRRQTRQLQKRTFISALAYRREYIINFRSLRMENTSEKCGKSKRIESKWTVNILNICKYSLLLDSLLVYKKHYTTGRNFFVVLILNLITQISLFFTLKRDVLISFLHWSILWYTCIYMILYLCTANDSIAWLTALLKSNNVIYIWW